MYCYGYQTDNMLKGVVTVILDRFMDTIALVTMIIVVWIASGGVMMPLVYFLLVFLVAAVLGRSIFNLFLGTEYAEKIWMFLILLITQVILMSYVAIHPFFSALGHAKEDFIFALLTNLLYLGLAFMLVRHIGIYGIIISIFIQGMTYIGLKTYYIRKRDLRGCVNEI